MVFDWEWLTFLWTSSTTHQVKTNKRNDLDVSVPCGWSHPPISTPKCVEVELNEICDHSNLSLQIFWILPDFRISKTFKRPVEYQSGDCIETSIIYFTDFPKPVIIEYSFLLLREMQNRNRERTSLVTKCT